MCVCGGGGGGGGRVCVWCVEVMVCVCEEVMVGMRCVWCVCEEVMVGM